MKKLLIFSALVCLTLSAYSQHIYPEVYDNCYLDEFIFEQEKIIVPQEDQRIKEVVMMGWDKKMTNGADGILGLQILIDNRGRSCLMSVRNDTNLKLKKMNLEENINNNLKWQTVSKKVSAIILLEFDGEDISVKRLGTVDMVNLVEIKN